jgi:TPP-dependent indolepyruvate ferredoxin oxidoreductase alpha subunit
MPDTVARVIAQAIYDAETSVVTNVPGFGGTQVFEAFVEISGKAFPCSFHEEVAYSIAHGASLAGRRSATLVKGHGLAKAANSLVDSLFAGTTAGFLILVFDDKLGKHSDSIFDVAGFIQGLRVPYRISQASEVYDEVLSAFARSEELQLPIVVLVDSEDLDRTVSYTPIRRRTSAHNYQRDVAQHLVSPPLAEHQRQILDAKLSNQDWRAMRKPVLPTIPEDLPEAWQETARSYVKLFTIFQKVRGEMVFGDTGISSLFAFPPYNCVDVLTYMGGSVPLAIGAHLAGYHDAWAVTGDFSFIAAGHLGLVEAMQRGIPLKVLIFHNGKAEATGGQIIPARIFEQILKPYGPYVRSISNSQNAEEIENVLMEANRAEDMRIVVADYYCGH